MPCRAKFMTALFALACFALCMSVFAESEVELPVSCRGDVCVVPKDVLMALFAAHNEHVDEIRRLTALKDCPKFKKDRDA